jgi:hypothetical protein
MANRYFYKNHYSLEVDVVHLFAEVKIGASGAVTSAKGGGIASVTKESTAGQYTIKFSDKFSKFLGMKFDVVHSSISGVAFIQVLESGSTFQADIKADQSITIQLLDFAGAAVNAPSGAALIIESKFRVSSIGRND